MCLFFHKWGKWEQYTWTGRVCTSGLLVPETQSGKWVDCEEKRQKRVCSKCGKMEDEEI